MIEIEKRIKIHTYTENPDNMPGLFVLTVAVQQENTPEFLKDRVINHLRSELEIAYPNNSATSRKTTYLKDLQFLSRLSIVYCKHDVFDTIHYYQMVLNASQELLEEIKKYNSYLPVFSNRILQDFYHIYPGSWVMPGQNEDNFVYSLFDVRVDKQMNGILMDTHNRDFSASVKQIYKSKNHIAISFNMDVTKTYQSNAFAKVKCKIYDNLQEAFADRTNNTMAIEQYDNMLGRFALASFAENNRGTCIIKTTYCDDVKLLWYKDMAVFYDGEKSKQAVLPYLNDWYDRGIKQIDILQFCHNQDFFYQAGIGKMIATKKLVIAFVNKNKLCIPRSDLKVTGRRHMGGEILYSPSKSRTKIWFHVALENGSAQYLGSVLVPVGEDNIQTTALEAINTMIKANLPMPEETVDYERAFCDYKHAVFGIQDIESDSLTEWFNYCTRLSKNTEDGIVRAYTKMKKNLEKEYQEIGSYLSHYNFSQCLPIPSIIIDKKMLELYYKTLHIEPKNIIIKSINNKSIQSIQELQPMLTFMFINNKGQILKNDYTLNKFYNAKTNMIELCYNKLKGEVLRDKVKNR